MINMQVPCVIFWWSGVCLLLSVTYFTEGAVTFTDTAIVIGVLLIAIRETRNLVSRKRPSSVNRPTHRSAFMTTHVCGPHCKHNSDCAVHNAPAYKQEKCDCQEDG